MIKYLYYLFTNSFDYFIIVRYSVVVVLFFYNLLGLSVVILLLDRAYRPEAPQYPFHIIYDRILPFICLFLPSILAILFPMIYLGFKFRTSYIIHCLILVPLFYYWSNLRNWNKTDLFLCILE